MTLELEQKELHEIICGLHKQAQKIAARLRHTEAQIAEYTRGGAKMNNTFSTSVQSAPCAKLASVLSHKCSPALRQ